jgi:hypothetical protein
MNNYLLRMADAEHPNYGYSRTPTCDEPHRLSRVICSHLFKEPVQTDTVLWPALFQNFPGWLPGLQGTGDCVSWGFAHMADVLMCLLLLQIKIRQYPYKLCSESIYGFGKAELFNRYRWDAPGMAGVDAMKACQKFGSLYRTKYDGTDLTVYSGERAIAWGEQQRRTHGVPDELEPFARIHRAFDYVLVDSVEDAAGLIGNGYPFIWCGNTQWGVVRDADGVAKQYRHGAHCLTATGVRFFEGRPALFWIANTGHGAHVTGPVGPIAVPDAYASCGSWVPADIVARVIDDRDCYSLSFIDGFSANRLINWQMHYMT